MVENMKNQHRYGLLVIKELLDENEPDANKLRAIRSVLTQALNVPVDEEEESMVGLRLATSNLRTSRARDLLHTVLNQDREVVWTELLRWLDDIEGRL